MKTYNQITLCGHVGADPDLKYVDPTTPVARFNIATHSEGHITPEGRYAHHKVTDWHTVYCYYSLADLVGHTIYKGQMVKVVGRLSYTTLYLEKQKMYKKVAYIIADSLEICSEEPQPELIPVEEKPNNPYGDYIKLIEEQEVNHKDLPF